jgi:hypothetical protein
MGVVLGGRGKQIGAALGGGEEVGVDLEELGYC